MKKRRFYTLGALALGVIGALLAAGRAPKAAASVRVPTDGAEIVETLPHAGTADPRRREVGELRRILATDPANLRAALRLARLDIQFARERSDPRYLGQAQAVLAPWWNDEAPAPVLVLRATIEQSLHDFASALRHLDLALTTAPNDPQAWLTRALILTVRGRYEEARASCARVAPLLADELAFTVCDTQIDSLIGRARPAHDRLATVLDRRGRTSQDEEEWAISSLGEYAARFEDVALAERYFRRSLELAPDDAYVRGALADLLTDVGRYPEAVAVCKGAGTSSESNDALLLRVAVAERRGKLGGAEHISILEARFDASRARGDMVHRREEARFWLELRDEPTRALELAKANWEVQKEPWDARVLLASAIAASARDAALDVVAHLQRTKLEDPEIARLSAGLRR